MTKDGAPSEQTTPQVPRRTVLTALLAGGVAAIGGVAYRLASPKQAEVASRVLRKDGRPRLPPHQHLLTQLKDMGGSEGDPSAAQFKLAVHGEVENPFEIDFRELLAFPQIEQTCDVHCVTKWTLFDALFTGVSVNELAKKARVKSGARHVIFEGANGYTANVRIDEALAPNVIVAHRHNGRPLPAANGAPARIIVPDLYFWKSTKWVTGIRFVTDDEPGYWENRGYHNHADPWREERYG